jgi:glycerophosphoryl diester phosphodiesterase
MPSFADAVSLGYRYLETDVQLTADGVLVAFHDDDLQRTCGRPGKISELNWSEVAKARVDGREPIPLLTDLFDAFPEARINIDCKTGPTIEPLAATLRRCNALPRVCVGSFSDKRIRRLRSMLGPDLCTSFAPFEVVRFLCGNTPSGVQAAQVPVRQGPIRVVTARSVARAHAHGVVVHVWTVDDAAEMNRLLDLGVDGLMTDETRLLKQVFRQRGLPW